MILYGSKLVVHEPMGLPQVRNKHSLHYFYITSSKGSTNGFFFFYEGSEKATGLLLRLEYNEMSRLYLFPSFLVTYSGLRRTILALATPSTIFW